MCGIVGSFRPLGGEPMLSLVERMRDRMSHRGPDGVGMWTSADQSRTLGHRRLSIIDLSDAAAQPMVNAAGTVAVTFNGEIYNHADIRRELEALGKYEWKTDHSDTEMLLHAYEEWGVDCVKRFYGMFAVGIYDARDPDRPVLHLIRDRVGIKPLYFTKTSRGEWLFASEIRALLAHPDVTAGDGSDRVLALPHVHRHAGAADAVSRHLQDSGRSHRVDRSHGPRHVRVSSGTAGRMRRATLTEKDLSEDEAVAEITRLLKQSIARRMVSDVPFGVLLSGGVDSSLNVALMSELMSRPVTTFTIGYEGKEDYNEFQFARQVSQPLSDRSPRDADQPAGNAGFPAAAGAVAGRADCRQRLHPAVFPGASWSSRPARRSCRWARAPTRTSSATGGASTIGRSTRPSISRRGDRRRGGSVCAPGRRLRHQASKRRGARDRQPRRSRRRSCSGAARSAGGARCARASRPTLRRFQQSIDCPVEGLLPDGHRRLDSHAVVEHYLGGLTGHLTRAGSAAEDSLYGDEAAAARAPADARRQAHDGARDRGARAVPRPRSSSSSRPVCRRRTS